MKKFILIFILVLKFYEFEGRRDEGLRVGGTDRVSPGSVDVTNSVKKNINTTTSSVMPTTTSTSTSSSKTPVVTNSITTTTSSTTTSTSTSTAPPTTTAPTTSTSTTTTKITTVPTTTSTTTTLTTTKSVSSSTASETSSKPTTTKGTTESVGTTTSSQGRVAVTTAKPSANNNCFCVPDGECGVAGGNQTENDGEGQMDLRIINTNRDTYNNSGSNDTRTRPASTGVPLIPESQFDCDAVLGSLEGCCPSGGYKCGRVFPPLKNTKILGGRSYFGEFPWQAIIFGGSDLYLGSAVLIDQRHLLTSAHKIQRYIDTPKSLKIRLGDWETSKKEEPLPYMEFRVKKVVIHPEFNNRSLQNSIAVIRVDPPVPLGRFPTIGTACIPATPINQTIRCFISGWGRNDFEYGTNQAVQRKIDVPIIPNDACQDILRMTKLGRKFQLHPGFMCAGGEKGKDACTGDGGAPLVCKVVDQWYAVGLVSWGINCGFEIPGVYMNISYYLPWIQSTTSSP